MKKVLTLKKLYKFRKMMRYFADDDTGEVLVTKRVADILSLKYGAGKSFISKK